MKKLIVLILVISSFSAFAKKYKGAEIRTLDSYTYGKFEVRMKSPRGSGMLSSFFTFYDSPDFAQNWNEIDIEILGRYENEVQFNAIVGNHQMHEHRQVLDFCPHDGFHLYSFEWTPDYIAWQVDGKEVYRQDGDHIKQMNKNQKLMMNIWPSTFWNWTGLWNDSILPVYAYYDYVKYYEYTPKSAEKFTHRWTDNFDMMDASKWQTATHTFNGNSCDFDPSNVVFKDGYLILCLTKEDALGYNGGPITDTPKLISAKLRSDNSLLVTFSRNMMVGEIKKSNFNIEGMVIKKTKLAKDKKGVEIYFENTDVSGINKVSYTLNKEKTQDVSVEK